MTDLLSLNITLVFCAREVFVSCRLWLKYSSDIFVNQSLLFVGSHTEVRIGILFGRRIPNF